MCKNCVSFTTCISRISNAQADDAQCNNLIMLMYNLIEYSDNCSKTSANLWQYCRDEPAVNNNGAIVDFTVDNAETNSIKMKEILQVK